MEGRENDDYGTNDTSEELFVDSSENSKSEPAKKNVITVKLGYNELGC
jgi:hypothetical protein